MKVSAGIGADLSKTRGFMSPSTQNYSLAEIANNTKEPWTRMYAEQFGEYGVGMGTSARR